MTSTVLTTVDREGWWWACPATSVASLSVSAGQRLLAISIAPDAAGRDTFATADALAIHVLGPEQEALADHFARHPTDFDTAQSAHGLRVECGFEAVPLLADVASRLECRRVNVLTVDEKVVLLAKVVRSHPAPLLRQAS
ncbi:flavin reductase family protein [Actinophytocola sp.]|uniref:flavin reductase family protein n=1 Tax=Actinophytocola sp. TaxID=1872138 RepID=UPI00389AA481